MARILERIENLEIGQRQTNGHLASIDTRCFERGADRPMCGSFASLVAFVRILLADL